MTGSLERTITRVTGTPLLVTQRKLDVILNVLSPRLGIEAPEVDAAAMGKEAKDREYEVENGVAIVPVVGTLLHRRDGLDAASGLMNYAAIGDLVEAGVNDPGVHHIIMDVDSSGGEANGVFDQVDRIYNLRGTKPITAVVNEEANSAAYAIASAADRVVMTRTAIAGSIGVIATHVDRSEADQENGLKITHIYAGEKKADFSPHKPLTDAAAQRLQEQVDQTYDVFVQTVARNRGMSEQAVRDTQAGFFLGQKAVSLGLADGVESVDSVIQRVQEGEDPMSRANQRAAAKGEKKQANAEQAGPDTEQENQEVSEAAEETQEAQAEQEQEAQNGEPEPVEQAADASAEASLSRDDAAAIVEACASAGVPHMASGLIRQGLTVADAKQRVQSAGQIRDMCAAAGIPDTTADELIESGVSVQQAKSKLFEQMVAGQSADIAAHVGPSTNTAAETGKPWKDVYAKA